MNPLDFISLRLCLSFVCGIILGWTFPWEPSAILLPLVLSFAVLLATLFLENYRHGVLFGISVLCSATCLGILSISLVQPGFESTHYSHSVREGNQLWEVRVKETLKSTDYYHKYVLEVTTLNGFPASGRLLGKEKRGNSPPLMVDEHLLIQEGIQPIPPPLNPYQFAYNEYMEVLGVYDQVYLTNGNYTKREAPIHSIRGQALRWRETVISGLNATSMGEEEVGVIRAILLGDRNELDPEVYGQYRDAGAAHILAVSGLHLGILLLLIRFFLKPLASLRYGKTLAAVLSIALIWAYAVFTGLSPSVVRAAAMFSFLSCALYLNRPSNTLNILALSMLAILLIEPRFLFRVGFQLSYAAVLAIAWVYPVLLRAWYPRNRFLKKLWKLTAVSLAAQLGVMPLCLYYFHQFPGLFLLSALLLVPALGLLIGAGIPVAILSSLNKVPEILALAYSQLIGGMNGAVRFIARQEAFVIRDIPLDEVSLALLYLLLAFLVLSLQKPRFRNLALLGVFILSLQAWTLFLKQKNWRERDIVLLHRVGDSGILYQEGKELHLFSDRPEGFLPVAKSFSMHRHLRSPSYRKFPKSFEIAGKQWIALDSTGKVPPVSVQPEGLLLLQSPKVHLGRLLEEVRPRIVVADGSNYLHSVERWRNTCREYGVPFFATAESGALSLEKL